ncbi:uncharacterized protein LOC126845956 [Adelges cooleyi]|uniref:uncharacterized protein LOC126845956 n=1 Tax=Adelges cooleyi TaxID=133065 RepID=UPI00217F7517|nr:uncharacterized protein LOC126845956 [Adelges cooleyi]
MDIADKSKIMEDENERFFKELLSDSESNKGYNQTTELFSGPAEPSASKKLKTSDTNENSDRFLPKPNNLGSISLEEPDTSLVQSIITMHYLNGANESIMDSGYNTISWKKMSQSRNKKPQESMSDCIMHAVNCIDRCLFDESELLSTIIEWHSDRNIIRYLIDMIDKAAKSDEFALTCRDFVTDFVRITVTKILNDHHKYNSVHVEYQCNLLAKFCYDKYLRWNIINMLIDRLKPESNSTPSPSSSRSVFYAFHMIDRLLVKADLCVTDGKVLTTSSIPDLWKINHEKKCDNYKEEVSTMIEEWKNALQVISVEALKNNVFLLSFRANQCLENIKLLTTQK